MAAGGADVLVGIALVFHDDPGVGEVPVGKGQLLFHLGGGFAGTAAGTAALPGAVDIPVAVGDRAAGALAN